jgi:hypothetical protein
MFTNPFYYQTVRKTIIAFGSLFNNLYIVRKQDDNDVKIKVPIIYSTKEKFIQRYNDTLNRDNNDSIVLQTILPKMGYEIGEIAYDPSRKKISVNKRIIETEEGIRLAYTEVPYNVNIALTAYVRYVDDGLQIMEQILPFFTPDFTVAIKQKVLNQPDEHMNIPFILNSVGQQTDYEGSMEVNSRMIMWTYNFTAKINLFGPLSDTGVIRYVDIDLLDMSEFNQ